MPYWKPHLEPLFPADYLAQNSTGTATPEPELAVADIERDPASLGEDDPPTVNKTTVNSIGMKLTLIPAGEFQMGSPDSEPDRTLASPYLPHDDETQHLVKISKPFYLGVYEVTQQQYEKVMGTRPWQGEEYVKEGPDYPAVDVIHDDAVEFCRRLSKQEGVEYRLPTEAEWEYACRAGTTTAYSFGDDESKLGQYAWYDKNAWHIGEEYAHRVGQKLPNPWGLYDMHGNVWERCQDWYGPYGSEKVVSDPAGPAEGGRRVLRGGAFLDSPPSYVRSAYRFNARTGGGDIHFGFRAARTYSAAP
jgi:formylglycine-generating enzyme required for sulfatase activity